VQPVFGLVAEAAGVELEDLRSTLNLGIGMTLVTAPERVEATIARAVAAGHEAFEIGRVVPGAGLSFA
jgi:phosphoribosylformylglycinamidine cyclo-ligase